MVKLTFCLRRQPGVTRDEFQAYWRETHGPLVADRAAALGVRRYVQVHTVDADGLHARFQARNGGSPEPYDGVAELWFDSLESIVSRSDDAARAAGQQLLADERNFIDLANSPMWIGEEHVVVGS